MRAYGCQFIDDTTMQSAFLGYRLACTVRYGPDTWYLRTKGTTGELARFPTLLQQRRGDLARLVPLSCGERFSTTTLLTRPQATPLNPSKILLSYKMSAIEESDGPVPVFQVLFALHPSFGAQELCGPLEVLSIARHKINDPGKSCPPPMSMPFQFSETAQEPRLDHTADALTHQQPRLLNAPLLQVHRA